MVARIDDTNTQTSERDGFISCVWIGNTDSPTRQKEGHVDEGVSTQAESRFHEQFCLFWVCSILLYSGARATKLSILGATSMHSMVSITDSPAASFEMW